jgi:metallo-beta-lactamase class B
MGDMMHRLSVPILLVAGLTAPVAAQVDSARAAECSSCAEWNTAQAPFRVYGNTYWVGTHGLGSVLITSPQGHVLIDGALPESAPLILASIRALGFRPEDVKLILNTHAHFDHAGGIAALQRATGARVATSPWSATVLEHGTSGRSDPQYGVLLSYPAVSHVDTFAEGDTLRVGPLAVVAHFTGGHTPGGTSWSWRACDGSRCRNVVYADSQTPVSADGFLFTKSTTYPSALADFGHGFATLEELPCDILLTPHPDASQLWQRLAAREAGNADALMNPGSCRAFAAAARDRLAKRVADEGAH